MEALKVLLAAEGDWIGGHKIRRQRMSNTRALVTASGEMTGFQRHCRAGVWRT